MGLALYPQMLSWVNGDTNNSFFVSNYDEPAYAAYVNSLINGKTRKFDPFFQSVKETESLYSIQFIPAYAIALPARALGITVSTAFIILSAAIALFSYLAILQLFSAITKDENISAAATLAILCFGTAVTFQGELRFLISGNVLLDFLPFLRRYQPGFAFPIFFVFCLAVYRSVFGESSKRTLWSLGAGALFIVLVYSYFYLWTAAGAWAVCFILAAAIFAKQDLKIILKNAAIIAGLAVIAIIPYFYILSNRSSDLDSVQLLANTRAPILFSPVMIFGLIIGIVAIFYCRKRKILLSDPRVILLLSFAFVPIILLNQQILTGLSLQPVHYEVFIGNYLVLFAAAILAILILQNNDEKEPSDLKLPVIIMAFAAIWGFVEVSGSTSRASLAGVVRDRSMIALNTIANNLESEDKVVTTTNFVTADIIPTVASLRPLWNAHLSSAGSISVAENKRRFYLYLYFAGYGPEQLEELLRTRSFEAVATIFGSERALPELSEGTNQIANGEINEEVVKYKTYLATLNKDMMYDPQVSFIVVPAQSDTDLSNIDKWYQRDAGEDVGLFRIYKLTPKH